MFTVTSPFTGEIEKHRVHRAEGISGMLRLLYHKAYTKRNEPCRMQLMLDNRPLDSSSATYLTEPANSQFQVVATQLPLTWEKLCEKTETVAAAAMQTIATEKLTELKNLCAEKKLLTPKNETPGNV